MNLININDFIDLLPKLKLYIDDNKFLFVIIYLFFSILWIYSFQNEKYFLLIFIIFFNFIFVSGIFLNLRIEKQKI